MSIHTFSNLTIFNSLLIFLLHWNGFFSGKSLMLLQNYIFLNISEALNPLLIPSFWKSFFLFHLRRKEKWVCKLTLHVDKTVNKSTSPDGISKQGITIATLQACHEETVCSSSINTSVQFYRCINIFYLATKISAHSIKDFSSLHSPSTLMQTHAIQH